MLGTSNQNPVEGPINLQSTIAYAQQLRDGMIDWTTGKEWDKEFYASIGVEDRLDGWRKKFADGSFIVDSIDSSGRIELNRKKSRVSRKKPDRRLLKALCTCSMVSLSGS